MGASRPGAGFFVVGVVVLVLAGLMFVGHGNGCTSPAGQAAQMIGPGAAARRELCSSSGVVVLATVLLGLVFAGVGGYFLLARPPPLAAAAPRFCWSCGTQQR